MGITQPDIERIMSFKQQFDSRINLQYDPCAEGCDHTGCTSPCHLFIPVGQQIKYDCRTCNKKTTIRGRGVL